MKPADYTRFRPLAERLADAAGAVARRYFRTPMEVERKADESPVTRADREAEAAMRALIAAAYPEHGIIGEEHPDVRRGADYLWVLDPIDGTKAFISGKPSFGVLVALLHGGVPVLGVIDQPVTRERWVGIDGAGASLNGAATRTRPCAGVARAMLYATSPEMFQGAHAAAFARVRDAAQFTRYGADCYAYGLLASGYVDLVVEASLRVHDYCALVPVIRNAGGIMSDWDGQALGLESDGRVIAAGDGHTYREALGLLGG